MKDCQRNAIAEYILVQFKIYKKVISKSKFEYIQL